jgi:hypothetical protein
MANNETLDIVVSESEFGFGSQPKKARSFYVDIIPVNSPDQKPINTNRKFMMYPVDGHYILLGPGPATDPNAWISQFGVAHDEKEAYERTRKNVRDFIYETWNYYETSIRSIVDKTPKQIAKDLPKPFFF